MAKRRRVLMGMGALVFGSGALSVNAAFNNNVNPASDMRVVADEQLRVEPGTLFRDGSNDPNGTINPSGNSPGPNGESLFDQSSNSLFGGNSNDGLANISASDIPAVSINNDTNSGIFMETAVGLDESGSIGDANNGVFQVVNNTSSDEDIAIRFSTFGVDVDSTDLSGSPDDDDLARQEVVETFKFNDAATGDQISTDDVTTSPQTVDNVVTVTSGGGVVQISIDYDTQTHYDSINNKVSNSGNPFSGSDTVDLVNEISVGIEDGTDVSP